MNTGKHMIALFIVIGACLGIAAFVLVLTSKQKCHTKEPYLKYNAAGTAILEANSPEDASSAEKLTSYSKKSTFPFAQIRYKSSVPEIRVSKKAGLDIAFLDRADNTPLVYAPM